MTLSPNCRKYRRPRNFVEGYKLLRWEPQTKTWRSQYSSQVWEFGIPVEAKKPPRCGAVVHCPRYEDGIHAWGRPRQPLGNERLVKVLLFGVTHSDKIACRADVAVVIETLTTLLAFTSWTPLHLVRAALKRIPW